MTRTSLPFARFVLLASITFGASVGCDTEDELDLQDVLDEDDSDGADEPDAPASPTVDTPALAPAPDDQAAAGWRGPISEEGPALSCDVGHAIVALKCTGTNCDDTTFSCAPMGGSMSTRTWSPWISEEPWKSAWSCADDEYVTGLTCKGSYCDDLSLECSKTSFPYYASCRWTGGAYGSGDPSFVAGPGEFLKGVACLGSYCKYRRYLVCDPS